MKLSNSKLNLNATSNHTLRSLPRDIFKVIEVKGFALIATISILAILSLLTLAVLSIATVETRSGNVSSAKLEAQANARMALMTALAELQEAAGPDQRITASANINATNSNSQPHLLGVWKSWKQANNDNSSIDYDTIKSERFIQWLSSTLPGDNIDPTYPDAIPNNAITLVGEGSLDIGSGTSPIQATLIPITSGNEDGGYAWHIIDESLKGNIAVHPDAPTSPANKVAGLNQGGRLGYASLDGYEAFANASIQTSQKIPSLASSELIDATNNGFDPVAKNALLSLTSDSKSLLVNVVDGGYQTDLSTLFANTTLPSEYANRHIYSETSTPIAPKPTRFDASYAHPLPSPDPKWSFLHSHYNLYKEVDKSGGTFSMQASNQPMVNRGNNYQFLDNPVKIANSQFTDKQQLLPVLSNAQFIFSMAPQHHNLNTNQPYVAFLGFWVDFAITLWNPYNVELEFDTTELEFYRFPLQVEFFRNDSQCTPTQFRGPQRGEPKTNGIGANEWISCSNGNAIHIAQMFNPGNNASGEVNIQDKLPYRVRINEGSVTLKPGEFRVFGSPQSTIYHHQNWNFIRGHQIKEGFFPYNPSNSQGGIFERYISTSPTYQAQCPFNQGNHFSQQIKLKMGDQIGVKVTSARLNRQVSGHSFDGFKETNEKEVVSFLKIYQGDGGESNKVTDLQAFENNTLHPNRTLVGAVEIDLTDDEMNANLPTIEREDMPIIQVTPENTYPKPGSTNGQGIAKHKVPFLIASVRLKTEQDSAHVGTGKTSSHWIHNGVTNSYFSNIRDDQNVPQSNHQYEMTWEGMTDWTNIPAVEVSSDNKGYGATGVTSADGVHHAIVQQIPLTPTLSIAQFSNAPLNNSGNAPYTSQVVGNSFVSTLMEQSVKIEDGSIGKMLDHSYMANSTLFDGYFFSSIVAEATTDPLSNSNRSLNDVMNEFVSGTTPLKNSNLLPSEMTKPNLTIDTANEYVDVAQYLYNFGAFNVNSTSLEAWTLFLASGTQEALPILDALTANTTLIDSADEDGAVYSRNTPLTGEMMPDGIDYNDQERWTSHRRLSKDQIKTLAEFVVEEVKQRGPFLSISEFVNRRLSGANLGKAGALQAAIEASNINDDFGIPAPANKAELNSLNQAANTSDGAPSQITQSDLLNRLAPSITVRGDTFRIRAYGEVTRNGQTTKAWCEAIVQRGHHFVDRTQDSTTTTADLNATNLKFGRKFNIVSFRWLSKEEI